MAQIPIDIPYFRSLMLREKGFLYSVYKENFLANSKKIANVSDSQLTVLIKIVYLIANNVIETPYEVGLKLKKTKKIPVLKKTFQKNKDYVALIKGPRVEKIQALMKIVTVLPLLLTPLFNQRSK